MRNQYKGICYRCGKEVLPYQGHFEKVTKTQVQKYGNNVSGKKWLLQHADCAIKHRGENLINFKKGE